MNFQILLSVSVHFLEFTLREFCFLSRWFLDCFSIWFQKLSIHTQRRRSLEIPYKNGIFWNKAVVSLMLLRYVSSLKLVPAIAHLPFILPFINCEISTPLLRVQQILITRSVCRVGIFCWNTKIHYLFNQRIIWSNLLESQTGLRKGNISMFKETRWLLSAGY